MGFLREYVLDGFRRGGRDVHNLNARGKGAWQDAPEASAGEASADETGRTYCDWGFRRAVDQLFVARSHPRAYYSPYIRTAANQLSSEVIRELRDTFKHSVFANSEHSVLISSERGDNQYGNEIEPGVWIFANNFRTDGPFANEVFRFQHMMDSALFGGDTMLPSVIKRSNVINEVTLDRTRGLENHSKVLMDAFLENTPNGKSTKRIIQMYDAHAVSVSREDDPDASYSADFYVFVFPNPPINLVSRFIQRYARPFPMRQLGLPVYESQQIHF